MVALCYRCISMELDKYDEFMLALARGDRVSRHAYNVPPETIRELEEMDIIDRDEEGYHVAGPMFDVLMSQF